MSNKNSMRRFTVILNNGERLSFYDKGDHVRKCVESGFITRSGTVLSHSPLQVYDVQDTALEQYLNPSSVAVWMFYPVYEETYEETDVDERE